MQKLKKKLLIKGLVYDAIGMASYAVPVVGPFLDLLWAPYAAKLMKDMYPGKKGKIASVIVFLEEILPGTDIIPTFTLMWFYTFVWNRETKNNMVIEAKVIQ
jgi:hypothetical protein